MGIGGNYAGYRYFLERDLNADRHAVDYVGVNQDNPCTGLKDKVSSAGLSIIIR